MSILVGCNMVISTPVKANESELEMNTDRVIVFKDGYGLVVKKGTATTDANGKVFTDDVPDSAILGSFWVVAETGKLKSTIAGWEEIEDETERKINCTSVVEVVKANLGKECSFWISDDEKIEGTLLKVLSNDELENPVQPVTPTVPVFQSLHGAMRPRLVQPATSDEQTVYSKVTGEFFIVRTNAGDMMVPTATVKNMTIDDMVSTISQDVKKTKVQKRLTLKFDKPNSKIEINLMYFRPDLRWIPTYRVDLTEEKFVFKEKVKSAEATGPKHSRNFKTAELHLQGELLNEAEDFADVPIHVVVGVPNFRFRSIPSPMVLEPAIRNMLQQAAPAIMGNQAQMSNALFTQRSGEMRRPAPSAMEQGLAQMADNTTGRGGNDLYVYELDKMTLKKGERATVPILQSKVAYRDIYTWDIELKHSDAYRPNKTSSSTSSPLVLSENKIFRQIEMLNDTEIPWTTGAAMFVDGFQPLAQELLTYTSPDGACRVPVTVSVDLRGRVTDVETKRELNAVTWRSNSYARISGHLEVELRNNKPDVIAVEISLRLGGRALKASDDGKLQIEGLRREDWNNNSGDPINNSSQFTWTTEILPGESFKPNGDYEFFIR